MWWCGFCVGCFVLVFFPVKLNAVTFGIKLCFKCVKFCSGTGLVFCDFLIWDEGLGASFWLLFPSTMSSFYLVTGHAIKP